MRGVPFSVWRLMVAFSLMMAGTSLVVLIAGIIGTDFAPTPGLATLPIALAIVGVASSTLPTGRLLHLFGRRRVFLAYGMLAITAALASCLSLVQDSFGAFCLSTFALGWAAAAGHQYRFAALELVSIELAPKATSVLLLGGILGAFVGPEMAVRGRYLLDTEYAGSYLLLALGYLLGLLIICYYRETALEDHRDHLEGRRLSEILYNPLVVLAVCSAAAAYALMSFLMTATPISMHEHAGHSLEVTKWVIQSHIAAMYVPSLTFAWMLSRLGFRGMLWSGVLAYILSLGVALSGNGAVHYWLALVLLGMGWNFLYLTGTNLLARAYRPRERFKVQAFNDFTVFTVQAMVALSSGWFLFRWQWQGLLLTGCVIMLLYITLLFRTGAWLRLRADAVVTAAQDPV